jgi:hypothetical protein
LCLPYLANGGETLALALSVRWQGEEDGARGLPFVTLREARECHLAARQKQGKGIDPMVERRAESETRQLEAAARQRQAQHSFEKIARRWWEWRSAGKSPLRRLSISSKKAVELDVFPALPQLGT